MLYGFIIEFDQKGLKMVQIGEWIFKVKELKDYSILVFDYKREIYVIYDIGILMMVLQLLFQLIYKVLMERCYFFFLFYKI